MNIDPPEEDLGIRFVYGGVVTNFRGLKGKRQVIASNHNANVPALGGAKLIVALEGNGQHGLFSQGEIGSLDERRSNHWLNIPEGRPEAFSARQHLYCFR